MDAATKATKNPSRITGSHFLDVRHGPQPAGNSKRKKEVFMQQAGITERLVVFIILMPENRRRGGNMGKKKFATCRVGTLQ
jgi:hypothetical protein